MTRPLFLKNFLAAGIGLVALLPLLAHSQEADLPPGKPLLPESALPAYEKNIDHAGLIRKWDRQSLNRGRAIYQRVCQNCHGDLRFPGSIPLSLRFGEGKFQHGNDPFTMYQTMTRGWRLMAPQMQLVPRQKYDVIHYVRETFLKEHNRDQWFEVTPEYLAGLPKGDSAGPPPVKWEPWREMDYGNFLIGTFEIADQADRKAKLPRRAKADYVSPDANIAYKSITVRLDEGKGGVAQGSAWLAFEHDTMRVAGVWRGKGFIDWRGINFDGGHVVRPRTIGELVFETADGPGWANPQTGKFDDLRIKGLDGRRFGPLPKTWAKYRGLYRHGSRTVIAYRIGDAEILESHDLAGGNPFAVVRTINIAKSSTDLVFRAGNVGVKFVLQAPAAVTRRKENGFEVVRIPASATPLRMALAYHAGKRPVLEEPPLDLRKFTQGGPAQGPEPIEAPIVRGEENGAFAIDKFTLPPRELNPWRSWMRLGGVDFVPDEDAAVVCTWEGEVWRVENLRGGEPPMARWKRIASGLFQPLGIKIVDGQVMVACRDQIVRLRDLNGDGETDFYEAFNSDHQVTEHFHEFAMGLQADAEGNLYYAKSARHARPPLVPHHGTLLKVSADGAKTEILAKGFRAANGVCRNPDGTFFVTDQEGHWNPMNRINLVQPGNRFYGNMWGYGAPDDESDDAMEPPLCWVDKTFDRSPAELLRVNSKSWGALNGSLLNLSYGQGRLEIVPFEMAGGQAQGGLCALPIPDLPTGVMRGRFHPGDGHLYVCGLSAWATAQMQQPGGLYRIRTTGKPAHVPVAFRTRHQGVKLTFSDALDAASVGDLKNYTVATWALVRSHKYGSKRFDQRDLKVTTASLANDGRTVRLVIPELQPAWQLEIRLALKGADGEAVERTFLGTIHTLNHDATSE